MQTDYYTKIVLTVIAACLTIICAREMNILQSAHAEESQPVPTMQVEIMNTPTVRLALEHHEDREYRLPVTLRGIQLSSEDLLPVIIDDVRNGIHNELPVKR